MDGHIRPEGWHNWSKPDAEKNSFYAEYNCYGKGYLPASRVGWSYRLKASQAKEYTIEKSMGAVFAKIINEWNSSSK